MTSPHPPATEDPPTLYVRAPHVAWRRIGDETVVLDQNEHRLVALNPAGGRVWHRLEAPKRAEQLGGDLPGVLSFLEELADLGLLERAANGDVPSSSHSAANDDSPTADDENDLPPTILWQEPIQNAAQTGTGCAFLPGQNAICNSVPFS